MNIDWKTKIPLFSVMVAIPTVAGAILWLGNVASSAANAERVNVDQDRAISENRRSIQTNQLQFLNVLFEIRDRVTRIEANQKKGE